MSFWALFAILILCLAQVQAGSFKSSSETWMVMLQSGDKQFADIVVKTLDDEPDVDVTGRIVDDNEDSFNAFVVSGSEVTIRRVLDNTKVPYLLFLNTRVQLPGSSAPPPDQKSQPFRQPHQHIAPAPQQEIKPPSIPDSEQQPVPPPLTTATPVPTLQVQEQPIQETRVDSQDENNTDVRLVPDSTQITTTTANPELIQETTTINDYQSVDTFEPAAEEATSTTVVAEETTESVTLETSTTVVAEETTSTKTRTRKPRTRILAKETSTVSAEQSVPTTEASVFSLTTTVTNAETMTTTESSAETMTTSASNASPTMDANRVKAPVSQQFSTEMPDLSRNWGLERVSNSPGSYKWPASAGSGVTVYVVDTGVDINHPELEGRAFFGADLAASSDKGDNIGHGTHVAGIIASKSYGVAKKANIVSVKVFGDSKSTSLATIAMALQWILSDFKKRGGKAVVNLSVELDSTGDVGPLFASLHDAGIYTVVAAGNSQQDACTGLASFTGSTMAVAASDWADNSAWFTDSGKCVDIFAPGLKITSLAPGGTTQTLSGTSQAAPFVSGTLALALAEHNFPNVDSGFKYIKDIARPGVINNATAGTPNLYLFNGVTNCSQAGCTML